MNKRWAVGTAILTLILATAFAMLGRSINGFHPTYPYAEWLSVVPAWVGVFAQFDGVHYLTIARQGYEGIGLVQAFFPVYPLLMRLLAGGVATDFAHIISGRLISFFALAGIAYLWFGQKRFITSGAAVRYGFWLFLLWPVSFFLHSLYTESLFILLVITSLLCAAKKQWLLAGIVAGIASGTRVVGVLLFPALLIELLQQTNWRWSITPHWLQRHWKNLFFISLSLTGWLLYSLYLWREFQDPLLYMHVQKEFGAGRQDVTQLPGLVQLQLLVRYVRMLVSVPISTSWLVIAQEFFLSIFAAAMLLLGVKKVRLSVWFFSTASLLVPTMTGSLSSMPRYILAAPAVFLIFGYYAEKYPFLRGLCLLISAVLLVCNLWLYGQGAWVS